MPMTEHISAKQYRALQIRSDKKELFDEEVETLFVAGLIRYQDADPFRKDIPDGLFSIIPPRHGHGFDLDHLMELIEVNGKKGKNRLDPMLLTDVVTTPKETYLLCSINDGREYLGMEPRISESKICELNRSPITVYEGIIHCITFSHILTSLNCNKLLGGSRYGSGSRPSVSIFSDGAPSLFAWNDDADLHHWGYPSCKSRRGV